MKLGQIIALKDVFDFAYTLKLSNGARALRLRKLIAQVNVELSTFEALRNDFIKATGKDSVSPNDPEYADIIRKINEALAEDIDIVIEPLVEEADLEGVEASAQEIDGLYVLGLIVESVETSTKPAV